MSFFQKFKNLSIKSTLEAIWSMMMRFPMVVADTIVGTGLGVYLIEKTSGGPAPTVDMEFKVLWMCVLAFPLLIAITFLAERFQWKKWIQYGLQLVAVGALVGYYFLLPEKIADFSEQDTIRLVLLNIIAYLTWFFVPFLKKEKLLAEWKFIEMLFVNVFITGLFSGTLFLGLALSMWSVDYLFGVKWDNETYIQVWATIVGIFATWFYLSNLPKSPDEYSDKVTVVSVMRVFVQYILVPLLCIFYVILYAYVGKILFTWNWPLGGTAVWILIFSIAGVLTYLIGYPMQKQEEYSWIRMFFKIFFILILPLAIVLFMAIGIRIKEYGVTESRYLVVLFGVWLILLAVYYLLSKRKHVIAVPVLTSAFFLISLFGPWSMFSISYNSQFHRLENLLVQNNLLVNGKVQPLPKDKFLDYKLSESIRSKTQYVVSHGGVEDIQPWFNIDLKNRRVKNDYDKDVTIRDYEIVDNAMYDLSIDNSGYGGNNSEYFSFFSKYQESAVLSTQNYQNIILNFNQYPFKSAKGDITYNAYTVGNRKIQLGLKDNKMEVKENNLPLIQIDLTEKVKDLFNKYGRTSNAGNAPEEISVEGENEKIKIKMYLTQISGDEKNGAVTINDIAGNILVTLK